jgi:uncharacterized membrane protein
MDEQARYEQAKKRVTELKDFYQHLIVYLAVNAFLVVINLLTSPGHLWFYWPLLGWGIGVAIHAATVFGSSKFWGSRWEERKIKELMDKDKPGGPIG